MHKLSHLKIVIALLLLFSLVSCAEDREDMGEQASTRVIDNVFLVSDSGGSPQIQITGQLETSNLQAVDIITGTGNSEVVLTDTLEVNYLGVGVNTGITFDSSYIRDEPAKFPLAAVIQGWQNGLIGMKEGGRRVLIIPANQAYGSTPPPGSGIEPNEALIFVVDLIKIL